MKKYKSGLDEQQELALLRIEHNTCWIGFWGLCVMIIVQAIIYGMADASRYMVGEIIILLCMSLYLAFACMRKGIWDRKLKANTATNFVIALVAAVIMGVVSAISKMKDFPDRPITCVLVGAIMGGMVFVACFVALEVSMVVYKKRVDQLENEEEEE